ncbi:GerAB/ArcD/ProY family transporter [Oceanobacillus sp. 1P07AA]|uniref:YkvI family membrane protein n=1 Tax=Oceanobacillus sp. 1P07AA TaxID=3132293 RepID=UPI0039A52D88
MWRSCLKWMTLILGTTIGAGYASGRELWQFFGHESGLAILLFAILFSFCCMVIMQISYRLQSTNYLPVLKEIVGVKLTKTFDILIMLYLFTTTMIMIAGSGATGQAFNLHYSWGIVLIVTILVLLFRKGINGLLTINQFILPILIGGLLLVLLKFTVDQDLHLLSHWEEQRNWMAAFPFTALNILPLIAVLGAIGNKVTSQKEIIISCIGSGLALGTVSYIYNNSLIQIADEIILYEIPLFAILKHYPLSMVIIMSILLWFAIFTTAASGVLGIATRVQYYIQKPMYLIVLVTLIIMIPLTTFGFSNLISVLYPIYAILNLYVLARLLLYPLWGIVNRQKRT